jgi:predicted TIM-barrel fold metal-dependent hydrolase
MISSDSHIVEFPDLFTGRIERTFVDVAPRIVQHEGRDWWTVEGELQVPALNPSRAGDRFDDPEERRNRTDFTRDVRLGGLDPDEWIKDNQADGVWGGVLFPSMSLVFYGIEDSALLTAVCRVYTDWACEFAAAHPDRLRAVAMINLDDVGAAVMELQRARARGAAGALIPVSMPSGQTYDQLAYDPFWAAAADLGMPVSLHVATNRGRGAWRSERVGQSFALTDFHIRVALTDMIMSGVFTRHPTLRVGSVEHEAGWALFWLQQMDHAYTESIDLAGAFGGLDEGMSPSDVFRRNIFIGFTEDSVAVDQRHKIGVGNLLWGNDYPHGESTFPRSQEIVGSRFEGVPDEDRLRMTRTNTAHLYNFSLPEAPLRGAADETLEQNTFTTTRGK